MIAEQLLVGALAGGLFALLTFVHFFADWGFQTEYEAFNKTRNHKVRAGHCLVYSLFFMPVLFLLGASPLVMLVSFSILFLSHFFIDTYIPVFLWAKYLRKINLKSKVFSEKQMFLEVFEDPLCLVLFISIDQICHLAFLWPIVFLLLL